VLSAAAEHDATAFQAVARWELQLDPVTGLDHGGALGAHARQMLASPPPSADGPWIPGRDELAATIATGVAGFEPATYGLGD
jgi:hypothetical protein